MRKKVDDAPTVVIVQRGCGTATNNTAVKHFLDGCAPDYEECKFYTLFFSH